MSLESKTCYFHQQGSCDFQGKTCTVQTCKMYNQSQGWYMANFKCFWFSKELCNFVGQFQCCTSTCHYFLANEEGSRVEQLIQKYDNAIPQISKYTKKEQIHISYFGHYYCHNCTAEMEVVITKTPYLKDHSIGRIINCRFPFFQYLTMTSFPYYANVCPTCKVVQGDSYVRDFFHKFPYSFILLQERSLKKREERALWWEGQEYFQAQRPKVLQHDGYQCVMGCPRGMKVAIHHIIPQRKFALADYRQCHALSNLVTLCVSCHSRYEGKEDARQAKLREDYE